MAFLEEERIKDIKNTFSKYFEINRVEDEGHQAGNKNIEEFSIFFDESDATHFMVQYHLSNDIWKVSFWTYDFVHEYVSDWHHELNDALAESIKKAFNDEGLLTLIENIKDVINIFNTYPGTNSI